MTRPVLPPHLRAFLALNDFRVRRGLAPDPRKLHLIPLAERKAQRPTWWMTQPVPRNVRTQERVVDSRGGALAVRVYRTDHANVGGALSPAVLYVHGGGFVVGGPDAAHWLCANLAAKTGYPIVSVDYRLAPEHPYPAALEDCYDALVWLAKDASGLGVDPDAIAVVGDSAGGNLAAALCLLARDEGGPCIRHQLLIYPFLDSRLQSRSLTEHTSLLLSRESCELMLRYYVADGDRSDPLVAPLLAEDFTELPQALIQTADHDSLRDDGRDYATRLAQSEVPVRFTNYLGAPHGYFSLPRLCRCAPQALAEIVCELTTSLGSRTRE